MGVTHSTQSGGDYSSDLYIDPYANNPAPPSEAAAINIYKTRWQILHDDAENVKNLTSLVNSDQAIYNSYAALKQASDTAVSNNVYTAQYAAIQDEKSLHDKIITDTRTAKSNINSDKWLIEVAQSDVDALNAKMPSLQSNVDELTDARNTLRANIATLNYSIDTANQYANIAKQTSDWADSLTSSSSAQITQANDITYSGIMAQNELLDEQQKAIRGFHTMNSQKSLYESVQIHNLTGWNYYLFIIYYVLFAWLILVFLGETTINGYIKFGIILALAIYPYSIYPIEKILYDSWMFLYALILGIPYSPKK
jgi:hypothetical protein